MHIALLHVYSKKPTPVYQEIATALRARGHKVWIGEPNADNDLEWRDGGRIVATQPGPETLAQRWRGWPFPKFWRRLAYLQFMLYVRRFLRHYQPDVVQVNPATMLWLWLLPLGMPHTMLFVLDWRQIAQRDYGGLLGGVKQWWARTKRQVLSTRIYDQACFLHAAGAEKVLGPHWPRAGKVVPLGVDPAFLQPPAATRPTPDPGEPVYFCYIGTLSRVRQLEQLLYAAQQMRAISPEFRLVLIGPDPAQGYYQQLIEQLDLGSVVEIRPPVPYAQMAAEVLRYDVALAYVPEQPADWQYHPTLKVLEYRAVGIPIIATDFVPNRDVVEPGANGLLVANDPKNWAAAMLRFVQDRGLLEHCQRQARAMRTGILWSDVAELYEGEIYGELLDKKVRPGRFFIPKRVQRI
jgi:glycosyltransferase involved in cell wall biosynthesis